MKKTVLAILCSSIFYFQTSWGQTLHYENQKIDKVDVFVHTQSGISQNHNSVITRMLTKPGGIFSQSDFDEDLKTLNQDYDRIEPNINDEDGVTTVTLHLWPKPTIHRIHWNGNHGMSTHRLQKELDIACGETFDRLKFNQAFHKLKAYYIKKGYFEAQLDYRIELDTECNHVTITVDICEGRSGKIQRIEFQGFCEREESELLHQMVTKTYNLFTSWLTETGTYHYEAIQQDQLTITNYLQNRGYADAQVEIHVEELPKEDRIAIIIQADKGERYYFGDISFEGNTIISDEKINALFQIRAEDPYSIEGIRDTIEILSDAYGRYGYVDAIIDFIPELIEGEYRYQVRFKIEEGEQYRVGIIRIFGNTCTKTPVILHETLLIPGEILNTVKLKATERRLANIGFFKNVNAYIVKGTESSLGGNYRDVYIEVEETSTGEFSAFLGFSSAEELFGGFNVTERNFNYDGLYYLWRDGLQALRGAGEFLHFTAQIGQKSRNYTLSWSKPYFRDSQWMIGFDLSNSTTRYISEDYDLTSSSLVLRAQRPLNQFVRFGVQYRLSNGAVFLHHDGSHMSGLKRASRVSALISAVGTSLSYDSTNHPTKPTSGFNSRLFLEFAGLGGDHQFLSLGYFNSYYIPVGSRAYFKFRGDFRFLQPLFKTTYQTVPMDERYFLGGEYLVRGYRPYRLGPQYHHDHAPKGGLSLQFYSVELTRRIMEDIEVFIFMDAGQLSKNTWEFGDLKFAIGYGTRFKLIPSIPNITLGMGYPLNPSNRSEVKKFFFMMGGGF